MANSLDSKLSFKDGFKKPFFRNATAAMFLPSFIAYAKRINKNEEQGFPEEFESNKSEREGYIWGSALGAMTLSSDLLVLGYEVANGNMLPAYIHAAGLLGSLAWEASRDLRSYVSEEFNRMLD